jgi:hypothetical protein
MKGNRQMQTRTLLLGLLLLAALLTLGCGNSITAPWVTEYKVPASNPNPRICLPYGTFPAIDRPQPAPDPVTGQCPPGWYRP